MSAVKFLCVNAIIYGLTWQHAVVTYFIDKDKVVGEILDLISVHILDHKPHHHQHSC